MAHQNFRTNDDIEVRVTLSNTTGRMVHHINAQLVQEIAFKGSHDKTPFVLKRESVECGHAVPVKNAQKNGEYALKVELGICKLVQPELSALDSMSDKEEQKAATEPIIKVGHRIRVSAAFEFLW